MVAIAQVVESFAYGTAKSVRQLCDVLAPGDEATVFYGRRQGTELDLKDASDKVRWCPLPGTGKSKHATNLRFLNQALARGFDVVHGHSSFGGLYAKMLGPRHRLSTLYSPRGFAFLREDFPAIGRWMFQRVESVTAGRCLTVCCGPYEHALAQRLGGRSIRINNGFEVHEPPSVDSLDGSVLGVGRICHQKGFDLFIEVARRLPQQSFVWVGEIQRDERALLSRVPENLQLIPYIPHQELLARIRSARLIFLPSRWEGLSRFLIESVCLGKAIVTSRFPANLDCLDGNPTQSRFANGIAGTTVAEFEAAVHELATDDSTVEAMQNASYRFAKTNFDIVQIMEQWRQLYHSLAERKHP